MAEPGGLTLTPPHGSFLALVMAPQPAPESAS